MEFKLKNFPVFVKTMIIGKIEFSSLPVIGFHGLVGSGGRRLDIQDVVGCAE